MKTLDQLASGPRLPPLLCNLAPLTLALALHLASPAWGALVSGVYQTLPGATAREWGDRVPNGSRVVPLFATLRFDLSSTPPALTATITNAVLEGANPFVLTIRSSSGTTLADGTYKFHGDYLPGTQYLFDHQFSTSTNGQVLWNGTDYWAGGHLWFIDISNIALVPIPWLDIAPAGSASIQISWTTNFADYLLESSPKLPAPNWDTITNAPATAGGRLSVTLNLDPSNRFYRLRKP